MMRLVAAATLVILLSVSLSAADADATKLQEKVEAALKAYNKDDAKSFFKEWTASQALMTTEKGYDDLYKTFFKPMFGTYKEKSLKLDKKGSKLNGDYPTLLYDAEFSKEKAARLEIQFAKEGDEYKFLRFSMSKKK
jgi:hypothetical protein